MLNSHAPQVCNKTMITFCNLLMIIVIYIIRYRKSRTYDILVTELEIILREIIRFSCIQAPGKYSAFYSRAVYR